MPEPRKLTPKQSQFVQEYLVDLNASAAYRRAGYTSGNADVNGSRLLGKASIQAAVQASMNERSKRIEVTQDFVLGNLIEINQRCLQRVPVMVGQGKDRRQAVDENGEGVWEFDAQGALRANELLGKHLKLFTDKTEHSGHDGSPMIQLLLLPDDGSK